MVGQHALRKKSNIHNYFNIRKPEFDLKIKQVLKKTKKIACSGAERGIFRDREACGNQLGKNYNFEIRGILNN